MEQEPVKILKMPTAEEVEQYTKNLAGLAQQLGMYAERAESLPDSDPQKAEMIKLVQEGMAKIAGEEATLTAHIAEVITALESHGMSKADEKEAA